MNAPFRRNHGLAIFHPYVSCFIRFAHKVTNSLVKIADASGNVVRQLKSTGGTATWNGRDDSGERVKSGVYYIMGSSSDSSTGKGGVCKLLIMR